MPFEIWSPVRWVINGQFILGKKQIDYLPVSPGKQANGHMQSPKNRQFSNHNFLLGKREIYELNC